MVIILGYIHSLFIDLPFAADIKVYSVQKHNCVYAFQRAHLSLFHHRQPFRLLSVCLFW